MNQRNRFLVRLVRRGRALLWLLLLGRSVTGCSDHPGYTDTLLGAVSGDGGGEPAASDASSPSTGDASMVPPLKAPCAPVVASESLQQREAVMAGDALAAPSTNEGVYTSELFAEFKRHCGDCHAGNAGHGGLSVNFGTFPAKVSAAALQRIRSDVDFMPPAPQGKPFSQRAPGDPIRAFAVRLEQWLADGSPADVFYPETGGGDGMTGDSPYLLSREVGMQMTNLANCVPSAETVGTRGDRAAELDARFEAIETFEDLPKSLRDTDLFTLDSAELAEYGVIAFAPAYTLWADHAKKIRFIRVPVGESVEFDTVTQSFAIPEDTRFYKTFLKRTVDLDGNERYRKMETRLIVSRSARRREDSSFEPAAVFGTYKWNDAETEATLVDTPYRDGTGFLDEVAPYVVDEQLDDEVLRSGPADQLAARLAAGSMRNYAIPGFDRCMHCHMGQRSFVLGFIPLQIHRRMEGEGGVIEPAERDELNQLQRLIDYGLITGMASPDDVRLLEDSQGERKPRNEHELAAQGYMLGNCAHCHNPDGFPSQKEAALGTALDFLPSEDGGIFQFPLEKFSPRTFRGIRQDIPLPYITPSLFDLDRDDLGVSDAMKWIIDSQDSTGKLWANDRPPGRPLFAPWRSLIYRNVDAPFSYQEAGTIFPHMPMDTPGYDCRARRLLGTWMVSIPARWKSRGRRTSDGRFAGAGHPFVDEVLEDSEPQPYEEAMPADPDYNRAIVAAQTRLRQFKEGERYNDCPDTDLDVLDPSVARSGTGLPEPQLTRLFDDDGVEVERYSVPAPARPHYFETDLRVNASWIIRRGDWYEILVEGADDPYVRGVGNLRKWELVRDALQEIKLDDVRELALQQIPFGLWTDKEACSAKFAAAGVARAGDFDGAARPAWMRHAPGLTDDSPVYATSPGAQVFEMICSKCHGPTADGQSSLASTIADLTGGLTRVANLRDGIFGPLGDPGANRRDAQLGFGRSEGVVEGVSIDDWAARYLVWMGLGGTRANIPKTAVASVGRSDVLGEKSGIVLDFTNASSADAANMLEIAVRSCEEVLPVRTEIVFDTTIGQLVTDPKMELNQSSFEREDPLARGKRYYGLPRTGLLTTNGHAELWQRLCSLSNPAPVRVVSFETAGQPFFYVSGLYERSAYPAQAPIGDPAGQIAAELAPANQSPWCVAQPTDPVLLGPFEQYLVDTGATLPMCPDEVVAPGAPGRITNSETETRAARWALRGAMNAGMSVFLYLDALAKGEAKPKPAHDRCEELGE